MGRPRGTVDERRPGVWRLRAEGAPDAVTGERQRVTRTVYLRGKRDAQQELARLLSELGRKPANAGTRTKSVADACEAWLTVFNALVAAGKKSPASGKRFREVIEWYVIPVLGDRSLRDLTTEDINGLYLHLLTKGKPARTVHAKKHGSIQLPRPLAAATVQKTHAALSLALDYAIRLGWLSVNPAHKAVKSQPDTEDRTITAPDPRDVQALLAEAERVDPEWACYLRVAASLGNRRGRRQPCAGPRSTPRPERSRSPVS